MAQRQVQLDEDQLSCPMCLDLPKDPVTINCGHSYCKGCINGFWDKENRNGLYSCPYCRQTFRPRPVLQKNTMLAEVMKRLRQSAGVQEGNGQKRRRSSRIKKMNRWREKQSSRVKKVNRRKRTSWKRKQSSRIKK